MEKSLLQPTDLKQASPKELLNNYFLSLGLEQKLRAAEIAAFYTTFEDLIGFKNADIETKNAYIEKAPNIRTGLLSAIEIGYQIAHSVPKITGKVVGSEDFGNYLIENMRGLEQEQLWMFALDTKHQILATDIIHIGSLRTCPFHTRDIVRRALQLNAQSVIIAHNHPSGKAEPSENDLTITNQLAFNCDLFEIMLLDSFIIGADEYVSLSEENLINMDAAF